MISYGPSLVPEVRAMRGRNYSLRMLHADATILDVSSANRKLSRNGLRGDPSDVLEADLWATSRLGRKPPMRSSVRLRIISGLPVIRHLGIGGIFTPALAKHSKSFSLIGLHLGGSRSSNARPTRMATALLHHEVTVNAWLLVALPPGVVSTILPVLAPLEL